MAWPRDERIKNTAITKHNSTRVKDQTRDYPNLEQGLVGAAILVDESQGLKWAFLASHSGHKGNFSKRLKLGRQLEIFPPTRAPPLQHVRTSVQQRAEQGANFLRTYVPDVEIAAELIRDQLVEETTLAQELQQFDPYSGRCLEIMNTSITSPDFIMFPMGETNRELNVSRVEYTERSGIAFKLRTVPRYTFSTPIQQILASKVDSQLAVRTYSATRLFKTEHGNDLESNITLTDLVTLSRADTANEATVDIKFLSVSSDVVVVGDSGTVMRCNLVNGAKSMTPIHQRQEILTPPFKSHFWRLSVGSKPSDQFLMSSNRIIQLDGRTNTPSELFSIPNGKHVLTSIEDLQEDGILRLSSTNKVIWLDPRFPGRPLLAYSHGRQYDRYLSLNTIHATTNNPLTLLSSRNNNLISVYDVSRQQDGLVRLNVTPYELGGCMYDDSVGHVILPYGRGLGLLRLTERGAINYSAFLQDVQEPSNPTVETPGDLQELRLVYGNLQSDVGPLGLQHRSQVDLCTAYDALFRRHYAEVKELEERSSDAVHDLLEVFPSYWQTKDLPVEHMLTTFDIAFRSGEEPKQASRADFLTQGLLNSSRGYRALGQGRLAARHVKAPWHCSITPVLAHLDRDFQQGPEKLTERLQKYDLSVGNPPNDQARRFESTARQQLELDLALSTDIFTEVAVMKRDDVDQALEVMTEALCLGDEPPNLDFGYLRPVEKKYGVDDDERRQTSTLEAPDIPMGVRLLLSSWDARDSEQYVYEDPYSEMDNTEAIKRLKSPDLASQRPGFATQTQRPPQVVASKPAQSTPDIMPHLLRVTRPPAFTQEAVYSEDPSFGSSRFAAKLELVKSSQEPQVSTQVLPGPHGGRPHVKKKPLKKRIGGF
ncbi:hypothetical protein B0H34DRAFT_695282 [Crassisporium funariophilum]|nr:hypothetical protein B0H34DRAFT_695282 [Crassisporium funariophilum]